MRTEQEMLALILAVAQKDPRIRAVYMNGSRANPRVPKDAYQDFDIVYVVRELEPFMSEHRWIDVFGDRLMLQMPEAMRSPSGRGHFSWMMLFVDGNRLDLTLLPLQMLPVMGCDSLSVTLLDKDGILPQFPAASDRDYLVTPPSELFYSSCCNNFWWCLQNVAKGIARDELPYAMMMYHTVVREELHDMTAWYIGATTDFRVSVGKMGKYFQAYLPPSLYGEYLKTYSGSDYDSLWQAISAACGLFHALALPVAGHFGYDYRQEEEDNMRAYLSAVRRGDYTAHSSVSIEAW